MSGFVILNFGLSEVAVLVCRDPTGRAFNVALPVGSLVNGISATGSPLVEQVFDFARRIKG